MYAKAARGNHQWSSPHHDQTYADNKREIKKHKMNIASASRIKMRDQSSTKKRGRREFVSVTVPTTVTTTTHIVRLLSFFWLQSDTNGLCVFAFQNGFGFPLSTFRLSSRYSSLRAMRPDELHTPFKDEINGQPISLSPFPKMPSELFVSLAQSQMELLAHSMVSTDSFDSKIKSMALYLPQENIKTGQLEFLPGVLYPHPSTERVFIANDASAGIAPALPQMLTKLPGFANATSLLPRYPMVTSADAGVGKPEEVMCDPRTRASALSVPLFSGSHTVGVLLVWPRGGTTWSEAEKQQVSRAAQSLSLALSMDNERRALQVETDKFRDALSDSLHQVKNPLQALRTYGKLLQRKIADVDIEEVRFGEIPQLFALAEHLMVQSERVVDLMIPMDSIVNSLDRRPLALNPYPQTEISAHTALTPWQPPKQRSVMDFSRNETVVEALDFSREPLPTLATSLVVEYNFGSPPLPPQPTLVGDIVMEMAFIRDILDPILDGYAAIAAENGIDFQVIEDSTELPGVMVCPRSLQEAVSNVLDNALKYGALAKSGSPFTINHSPKIRVILRANEQPSGVSIRIEDNGPGIPEEDSEAIFRRGFRRLSTSQVDGTGVGLDISLALLQRMGGRLKLAPRVVDSLDGAAFEFTLFRNPPC
jgi:signal transduction histidine kinase